MRLTPRDISAFIYCPYFKYTSKKNKQIDSKLTIFEECVVQAIKNAEKHCLANSTDITPRKIISKWDNVWWPVIAETNIIDFKQAQDLSVRASGIFVDYCKYDISGYLYPTAGVDIDSDILAGQSIIHTEADLVKVNLNIPSNNTHLVGFSNQVRSSRDVILDPAVRTLLYSFYSGREKTIAYTHICVREKFDKVLVTSAVLRHDDMDEVRKMIEHAEKGIRTGVRYMNQWNCQECKQCKSLES